MTRTDGSGVAIIGGTRFAAELAQSIKDTGNDVLLVDQSWAALSDARRRGLDSYVGDILSEQIEYHIDLTPYRYMLAMTEMDTYNAHVCADFEPDFGKEHLFQTAFHVGIDVEVLTLISGQTLFSPSISIYSLEERMHAGHVIRKTLITKQYSYTQYLRERDDKSVLLYILRADGSIEFFTPTVELQASAGDAIVALASPAKTIERVKERLEEENGDSEIPYEKLEEMFTGNATEGKRDIPGEAPMSDQNPR